LDILGATPRRLNILGAAAGTRQRARSLNILTAGGLLLRLRSLLQHCLSLADLGRALRLSTGDGRQRRDDCHAHDCREKSLHHRLFHFLSCVK